MILSIFGPSQKKEDVKEKTPRNDVVLQEQNECIEKKSDSSGTSLNDDAEQTAKAV